jgi:hypothetical protein
MDSRSGKQCRERYLNHLNPDVKKGDWTNDEDKRILALHDTLQNRWCKYVEYLPGRTDCSIKNRFHVLCRTQRASKLTYSDTESSFKGYDSHSRTSEVVSESDGSGQDQEHSPRSELENVMSMPMSIDIEDNSREPLSIEIPDDNEGEEFAQELLDLCRSPTAPELMPLSSASTDVMGYNSSDSNINPQQGKAQASLFSMQANSAGPLSARTLLQSTSFDSFRLPHFSPYLHSHQPFLLSDARAQLPPAQASSQGQAMLPPQQQSPGSMSSQYWCNFSPHGLSYMAPTSPMTPMIYAFEPSPMLMPKPKRQKLLYPYFTSPRTGWGPAQPAPTQPSAGTGAGAGEATSSAPGHSD